MPRLASLAMYASRGALSAAVTNSRNGERWPSWLVHARDARPGAAVRGAGRAGMVPGRTLGAGGIGGGARWRLLLPVISVSPTCSGCPRRRTAHEPGAGRGKGAAAPRDHCRADHRRGRRDAVRWRCACHLPGVYVSQVRWRSARGSRTTGSDALVKLCTPTAHPRSTHRAERSLPHRSRTPTAQSQCARAHTPRTHARTHAHTHTHTHARAHTRTRARAHTQGC